MMQSKTKLNFSYLWRSVKNRIPFWHVGRSKYKIGKTDLSVDEFELELVKLGYQYNYFSYTENGQTSNMRKLYLENDQIRQIHIRLFKDYEVRMHDELAYEYDAIGHINAVSLKRLGMLEENRLVDILRIGK